MVVIKNKQTFQRSKNPHKLMWYNSEMSDEQLRNNNSKFWEWEAKYNS